MNEVTIFGNSLYWELGKLPTLELIKLLKSWENKWRQRNRKQNFVPLFPFISFCLFGTDTVFEKKLVRPFFNTLCIPQEMEDHFSLHLPAS